MAWSCKPPSGTLSPCRWEGGKEEESDLCGRTGMGKTPSPSHAGHMGMGQWHRNQG